MPVASVSRRVPKPDAVCSPSPPRARAFSLTELLVVLAIIMLLVAIIVIATKKVRRMSNMSGDLNNQRQISLAQSSYSMDYNGAIASPRTGASDFAYNLNPAGGCGGPFVGTINGGNANAAQYHCWSASYGVHLIGATEMEFGLNTTNPADSNRKALSAGKLWPYIGDYGVYRSPLDPSGRIRSYSLNAFVGVTVPTDAGGMAGMWDDWFCVNGVPLSATNTTKISRIPQPARTMMSVVEDDNDGFNFNNEGWVIDPRFPGTPQGGGWGGWIDWPAMWDPTAIPFSYVDGSTEVYSVQRKTLPAELEVYGHWYTPPADLTDPLTGQPVRLDWVYFRDRLLPGVIPEGPYKSIGY
ncbi:MAG: prepilin-type N-terminal cleavage/methylation domain-containing protein [Planctomycetota bacterium]|nr:prepilin-type N-terminal cleavage/methylation domain-containing protein [Planctomycetota bacterium]